MNKPAHLSRRQLLAAGAASALLPLLSRGGFAADGGILRCVTPQSCSSLDPITGKSGYDHAFLYPIFDTLVSFDAETMKPIPGLARAWEYVDLRTLKLTLQENVLFHDGTPFDAEAVRFNLERSRTSDRSNIRGDFATVDSIEVTGSNEITLRLNRPDASLPLVLSDRAGMMVSPTAIEKLGEETNLNPVGTGQMRFVSWAQSDEVVYERNDRYWREGLPLIQGLRIKTITDVATALRSTVSGQADIAYGLSELQIKLIERYEQIEARITSSLRLVYIYLNYARPPFDDKRIRQALNYAIDREVLNQALSVGLGEPTSTILPKSHWASDPEAASYYSYNPEKAKQLLAEAGYPDGIDIHCLGLPDQSSIQMQEIILEQVKKAGIRLNIERSAADVLLGRFFGPAKEGAAAMISWSGRPDPSQSFQQLYAKGSFYNTGGGETPGVEEAIETTRGSVDLDERKKAFAAIQKLVVEEALSVPLLFRPDVSAVSTNVKGFLPNLLGKPKFDGVSLES